MTPTDHRPLPFAVFDEFGKPADDRVQDHIYAALSEALGDERASEPVAKIKPSQKSMRELLSEAALGDSQPVAKLTELCRGLEIPAPTAASCTPAMLYEIGRAIAAQAKEASPQRAEPASVQAMTVEQAKKLVDDMEYAVLGHSQRGGLDALRKVREKLVAALAAHPSTDQNHSG